MNDRRSSGTGSAAGVVLLTLASAQFLMTLDTAVMNVSIATVAKDVGTTVTGIQTAITLYTLVMASLMITGGKIGELIGRRRARFSIGCVIYGSGIVHHLARAPNLAVLIIGWSFLEGVGAAVIMPAIVALVAVQLPVEGPGLAPTGWLPRRVRSPWPRDPPASAGSSPLISRGGWLFVGEVISLCSASWRSLGKMIDGSPKGTVATRPCRHGALGHGDGADRVRSPAGGRSGVSCSPSPMPPEIPSACPR